MYSGYVRYDAVLLYVRRPLDCASRSPVPRTAVGQAPMENPTVLKKNGTKQVHHTSKRSIPPHENLLEIVVPSGEHRLAANGPLWAVSVRLIVQHQLQHRTHSNASSRSLEIEPRCV